MPKIEKSIFINAPVGKVFAFMIEPANLVEIWPSLVEIKNVQPLPNGGYCYDWIYKMAGICFLGQVEWSEFILNQRVVTRSESGIPSKFVWDYREEDSGMRLNLSVDYTIPETVLTKVTEAVINEMNGHEADTILANLRARVEG